MPIYDDDSQGVVNTPGTTLAVTQAGALAAQVSGTVSVGNTVTVSQSNLPAGTMPVSQGGALAAQVSGTVSVAGTVAVSQSNVPSGNYPSTQAGAWATLVSGTVGVTQAGALAAQVSGTVSVNTHAVTQGGAWTTQVSGTVTNDPSGSSVGAVTTHALSLSGVQLIAANTGRFGVGVYNQTSQDMYVQCGTTASLASFSVIVPVSGYYETPYNYNGAVWGIWAAAGTGLVYITEFR